MALPSLTVIFGFLNALARAVQELLAARRERAQREAGKMEERASTQADALNDVKKSTDARKSTTSDADSVLNDPDNVGS